VDAATIVGLLAEPDRRRVFAALVLGARTPQDVAAVARLDARTVGRALQKLQSSGLVDATLQVRGELIKLAAVTAAPTPDTTDVVDRFVRGDRLLSLPAQETKRRLVLDRVAQSFEPGRRYPERDVDAVLATWTSGADVDRVTLRRFLVDDGFLDRAEGEYWRAGGRVDV
jgi:hypothetical protein